MTHIATARRPFLILKNLFVPVRSCYFVKATRIGSMVWTKGNNGITILSTPATLAGQGEHIEDSASVKKGFNPIFSVRSWIADELSTLRGIRRPWCSLGVPAVDRAPTFFTP